MQCSANSRTSRATPALVCRRHDSCHFPTSVVLPGLGAWPDARKHDRRCVLRLIAMAPFLKDGAGQKDPMSGSALQRGQATTPPCTSFGRSTGSRAIIAQFKKSGLCQMTFTTGSSRRGTPVKGNRRREGATRRGYCRKRPQGYAQRRRSSARTGATRCAQYGRSTR